MERDTISNHECFEVDDEFRRQQPGAAAKIDEWKKG
jgi:hypothetical protein